MSIPKNVALDDYIIFMVDTATRPEGLAGLTVPVSISKDGAAFAAATNTPATEITLGFYKIDLTQAEINADSVAVIASASGADAWRDVIYPDVLETGQATIISDIVDVQAAVDAIDTSDLQTTASAVSIASTTDALITTVDTVVDGLAISFAPAFGSGTIQVDHDYPTSGNLTIKDAASSPVEDANVYIFLKSDYDAGNVSSSYYKGYTTSDVNGEWDSPIWLDAQTYTLVADGNGIQQVMVKEFTVT